jgi:hypothetical protein
LSGPSRKGKRLSDSALYVQVGDLRVRRHPSAMSRKSRNCRFSHKQILGLFQ